MKIIQKNKKAYFDYEILQKFITGIVLVGSEVKSLRSGNVNLKGAYISIQNGEAFIKNAHISQYKHDSSPDYNPFRIRKLLLGKKELYKIVSQLNTQGVTLIPLAIGLQGKFIKLEIALSRGKKKYDKRESIKGREQKRRLDRLVKSYQ